jgi:ComF family protein
MDLLGLLLPPACAGCGRYGSTLCAACRAQLGTSPGQPGFLARDPLLVVGDAVPLAVAAVPHRDVAQRALRRLKYGGGRRVAGPLAEAALPALRRLLVVCGPATLVPVPLHRSRRRDRGYNQAELLAEALGASAGLPVWRALVRHRETVRQHGLDRAARLRNLRDAMAFRPGPPPRLAGRAVVVVDDILTTGATMEACAAVLRDAGIEAVYGFAVAREV